jgi:hypothetical protein
MFKQALTYGFLCDGLESGIGIFLAGGYSASLSQHLDLYNRVVHAVVTQYCARGGSTVPKHGIFKSPGFQFFTW